MKKTLALLLSLTLCVGLFAGCAAGGTQPTPTTDPASTVPASDAPVSDAPVSDAPVTLSGTVSTDGSTSMEKVIGSLGEIFEADTGVTVSYNPTGSSAGITAVTEKRCDIGLSSRDLKDEEAASLEGTVVALDGIAMVVNPENPVNDLTVEQLTQIFTGAITNWKDVGGNDAEIVCFGREAGSGTRDGFESITDTKDKCVYRNEATSTGAVLESVKANPNAIGYASLSSVKDDIKALTVGGVAPSEATILDGTYQVQRDFVLITRKGEALSEAAQAFMDYATSSAASEIIIAAGAVPVAG